MAASDVRAGSRLRVCVTGSGGREHALALALGRTADVVVCPGNAGMAALGRGLRARIARGRWTPTCS